MQRCKCVFTVAFRTCSSTQSRGRHAPGSSLFTHRIHDKSIPPPHPSSQAHAPTAPQPRFLRPPPPTSPSFSPIEQLLLQHCGSISLQEVLVFAHQPDIGSTNLQGSQLANDGQQHMPGDFEHGEPQSATTGQEQHAEQGVHPQQHGYRQPAFWSALCAAMEAVRFKQIAAAHPSEVLALSQALHDCGVRHTGVWQAAVLRLAKCHPAPAVEVMLDIIEGAARAGVPLPAEAAADLVQRLCHQAKSKHGVSKAAGEPVLHEAGCTALHGGDLERALERGAADHEGGEGGGSDEVTHGWVAEHGSLGGVLQLQQGEESHTQSGRFRQWCLNGEVKQEPESQSGGTEQRKAHSCVDRHPQDHASFNIPDPQLARIAHAAGFCAQSMQQLRMLPGGPGNLSRDLSNGWADMQHPAAGGSEIHASHLQQQSWQSPLGPHAPLEQLEPWLPPQGPLPLSLAGLPSSPNSSINHTSAAGVTVRSPMLSHQPSQPGAAAFLPACQLLWSRVHGMSDVRSLLQVTIAATAVPDGGSVGATELADAACAQAGLHLQDHPAEALSALSAALRLSTQHARWCKFFMDSGRSKAGSRAAFARAASHAQHKSSMGLRSALPLVDNLFVPHMSEWYISTKPASAPPAFASPAMQAGGTAPWSAVDAHPTQQNPAWSWRQQLAQWQHLAVKLRQLERQLVGVDVPQVQGAANTHAHATCIQPQEVDPTHQRAPNGLSLREVSRSVHPLPPLQLLQALQDLRDLILSCHDRASYTATAGAADSPLQHLEPTILPSQTALSLTPDRVSAAAERVRVAAADEATRQQRQPVASTELLSGYEGAQSNLLQALQDHLAQLTSALGPLALQLPKSTPMTAPISSSSGDSAGNLPSGNRDSNSNLPSSSSRSHASGSLTHDASTTRSHSTSQAPLRPAQELLHMSKVLESVYSPSIWSARPGLANAWLHAVHASMVAGLAQTDEICGILCTTLQISLPATLTALSGIPTALPQQLHLLHAAGTALHHLPPSSATLHDLAVLAVAAHDMHRIHALRRIRASLGLSPTFWLSAMADSNLQERHFLPPSLDSASILQPGLHPGEFTIQSTSATLQNSSQTEPLTRSFGSDPLVHKRHPQADHPLLSHSHTHPSHLNPLPPISTPPLSPSLSPHAHALLHMHKTKWPPLPPQLQALVGWLAGATQAKLSTGLQQPAGATQAKLSTARQHGHRLFDNDQRQAIQPAALFSVEQQPASLLQPVPSSISHPNLSPSEASGTLNQAAGAAHSTSDLKHPVAASLTPEGLVKQLGLPAVAALLSVTRSTRSGNRDGSIAHSEGVRDGGKHGSDGSSAPLEGAREGGKHRRDGSSKAPLAAPKGWHAALAAAAAKRLVALHAAWDNAQPARAGARAAPAAAAVNVAELIPRTPPPLGMCTILDFADLLHGRRVQTAFQDWASLHLKAAVDAAASQKALGLPWWRLKPTSLIADNPQHPASSQSAPTRLDLSTGHQPGSKHSSSNQLSAACATNHTGQQTGEKQQTGREPSFIEQLPAARALNDVGLQVEALLAGWPIGVKLQQGLIDSIRVAAAAPVLHVSTAVSLVRHVKRLGLHKGLRVPRPKVQQILALQTTVRHRVHRLWGSPNQQEQSMSSSRARGALDITGHLSKAELQRLLIDLPALDLPVPPLLCMAATQRWCPASASSAARSPAGTAHQLPSPQGACPDLPASYVQPIGSQSLTCVPASVSGQASCAQSSAPVVGLATHQLPDAQQLGTAAASTKYTHSRPRDPHSSDQPHPLSSNQHTGGAPATSQHSHQHVRSSSLRYSLKGIASALRAAAGEASAMSSAPAQLIATGVATQSSFLLRPDLAPGSSGSSHVQSGPSSMNSKTVGGWSIEGMPLQAMQPSTGHALGTGASGDGQTAQNWVQEQQLKTMHQPLNHMQRPPMHELHHPDRHRECKLPSHQEWLSLLQGLLHVSKPPSPAKGSGSSSRSFDHPGRQPGPGYAGDVAVSRDSSGSKDWGSKPMMSGLGRVQLSQKSPAAKPEFIEALLLGLQPVLGKLSTATLVEMLSVVSQLMPCRATPAAHANGQSCSNNGQQGTMGAAQSWSKNVAQQQQQSQVSEGGGPHGIAYLQVPAGPVPSFYATAAAVAVRNLRHKLGHLHAQRAACKSPRAAARVSQKFSRIARFATYAACSLRRANASDTALLLLLEELVVVEHAFDALPLQLAAAAQWALSGAHGGRAEHSTALTVLRSKLALGRNKAH